MSHYNDVGYPNVSYRDRIRILLAGSIWSLLISIVFAVGVIIAGSNILFGIFSHLIALGIAFILLMVGSASLVALTSDTNCDDVAWSRCGTVKGLVGVAWVETVLLFIALVLIFALGVKARSGAGMRRGVLSDA